MKKMFGLFMLVAGFFGHAQNSLPESATAITPLLIGGKIPNSTLQSVDGNAVSMKSVLNGKRTVLVFYRGGWCPYCNAHLSALGEAEKELLDLGYQIVAVSPDAPKNLKITEEKDKVNYQLLSDSKGELIKGMGIAFDAPLLYTPLLKKGSDGENSNMLPVPSVFIVNSDREIEFEYISPDYKHRISNSLLIAVAQSLKK
jgi:peroxiredoxin